MKNVSSTVGFGIVGSGLMGGVFANALKDDTRNTRMAGVAGGSRAEGFAKQHGIAFFPTYEAMLASSDVDAVILATPHSTHLPQALAAAKAGKHIFLEKPMALNGAECRQMIAAAKKGGVLITVGHVTRRMEAPLTARRMIDQGDIGEIRMVETWRGMTGGLQVPDEKTEQKLAISGRMGMPVSWAHDPKEGGHFLDWGSHGCDITRWYAGADPVLAFGQFARYNPKEQASQPSGMAQFKFANGVLGHIWMTYELPHAALGTRARYLVVGSKAILDVAAYGQVKRSRADGGWDVVYQSDDFKGPDAGWGYPSKYMRQAFARQVQDLADAISQGKPMDVSAEDGMKAVDMVEAVNRAAATGESVRMPLK